MNVLFFLRVACTMEYLSLNLVKYDNVTITISMSSVKHRVLVGASKSQAKHFSKTVK